MKFFLILFRATLKAGDTEIRKFQIEKLFPYDAELGAIHAARGNNSAVFSTAHLRAKLS
jgi:hypothetical protein